MTHESISSRSAQPLTGSRAGAYLQSSDLGRQKLLNRASPCQADGCRISTAHENYLNEIFRKIPGLLRRGIALVAPSAPETLPHPLECRGKYTPQPRDYCRRVSKFTRKNMKAVRPATI